MAVRFWLGSVFILGGCHWQLVRAAGDEDSQAGGICHCDRGGGSAGPGIGASAAPLQLPVHLQHTAADVLCCTTQQSCVSTGSRTVPQAKTPGEGLVDRTSLVNYCTLLFNIGVRYIYVYILLLVV